jgi:hypothetical protein
VMTTISRTLGSLAMRRKGRTYADTVVLIRPDTWRHTLTRDPVRRLEARPAAGIRRRATARRTPPGRCREVRRRAPSR